MPVSELILPTLYPKQREAIFCDERYSVIEASTKSGKTVGCIAWILSLAWEAKFEQNFWWVAPVFPQAAIAFTRLQRYLKQAGVPYEVNRSAMTVKVNRGTIWFKSGDKPDSLFGEDVYGVVIDEATRCKPDVWYAVRSTLTYTKGPARLIGNVKGSKNWVYQLARKAKHGQQHWRYAEIDADDAVQAGVLDAEEIEDARRNLPEHVFRELYFNEPSEDEGNPFGIGFIRACVGPLSKLAPVVWGIDLASKRDWTVAVGLDETGHVCGIQRYQRDWMQTVAHLKAMVKSTPALVDMTGIGAAIVEDLQRACPNVEGLTFTQRTKQELIVGLSAAIQQQRITFPVGVIQDELESFEYIIKSTPDGRVTGCTYSAPPGCYDDAVCALALAVRYMDLKPTLGIACISGEGDNPRHAYDYDPFEDDMMWEDV